MNGLIVTAARAAPGLIVAGTIGGFAHKWIADDFKRDKSLKYDHPLTTVIRFSATGWATGTAFVPFEVHRLATKELSEANPALPWKHHSREVIKLMAQHPINSVKAMRMFCYNPIGYGYLAGAGVGASIELAKYFFRKQP